MIKALIKLWPALIPILIYIVFVLWRRKSKKSYIDGEYKVINENAAKSSKEPFSLQNKNFVHILYLTFILIIFSLIFIVLTTKTIRDPQGAVKIIVE